MFPICKKFGRICWCNESGLLAGIAVPARGLRESLSGSNFTSFQHLDTQIQLFDSVSFQKDKLRVDWLKSVYIGTFCNNGIDMLWLPGFVLAMWMNVESSWYLEAGTIECRNVGFNFFCQN